jgi:hypothetical protein
VTGQHQGRLWALAGVLCTEASTGRSGRDLGCGQVGADKATGKRCLGARQERNVARWHSGTCRLTWARSCCHQPEPHRGGLVPLHTAAMGTSALLSCHTQPPAASRGSSPFWALMSLSPFGLCRYHMHPKVTLTPELPPCRVAVWCHPLHQRQGRCPPSTCTYWVLKHFLCTH